LSISGTLLTIPIYHIIGSYHLSNEKPNLPDPKTFYKNNYYDGLYITPITYELGRSIHECDLKDEMIVQRIRILLKIRNVAELTELHNQLSKELKWYNEKFTEIIDRKPIFREEIQELNINPKPNEWK
jgi:hypothetical protein